MELDNPNKIHRVTINLDRDKKREREFRAFLDQQARNGTNRKETILQLFEQSLDVDLTESIVASQDKTTSNSNTAKTVKMKKESSEDDFPI